jgi:hypothetical protein
MTKLSTNTKLLVGFMVVLGTAILLQVPLTWGHPAYGRFTGTFLVALLAARLRVSLPKLTGSMKLMFNVAVTLIAAQAAWYTMQAVAPNSGLGLALGAAAYLLVNTIPVASIIALTESGNVFGIWRRIVQLTFPYFVLAAGVAGLAKLAAHAFAWYIPLLILPLMFFVQRSFTAYFHALREGSGQKSAYAMAAGSRA